MNPKRDPAPMETAWRAIAGQAAGLGARTQSRASLTSPSVSKTSPVVRHGGSFSALVNAETTAFAAFASHAGSLGAPSRAPWAAQRNSALASLAVAVSLLFAHLLSVDTGRSCASNRVA